jgi:hypothetical protein
VRQEGSSTERLTGPGRHLLRRNARDTAIRARYSEYQHDPSHPETIEERYSKPSYLEHPERATDRVQV